MARQTSKDIPQKGLVGGVVCFGDWRLTYPLVPNSELLRNCTETQSHHRYDLQDIGCTHTRTCEQQLPLTDNLSAELRTICRAAASCDDRTFLWGYACTTGAVQQSQPRSRSPAFFFPGFRHVFLCTFCEDFLYLEQCVFFLILFFAGTYAHEQ